MMSPGRVIIPALGAAVVVLTAGAAARAQDRAATPPDGPERPSGAQRIVRVFDFEEQDFNPLPVPYGWIRAQDDPAVPRVRPGFPIWNQGGLDYAAEAVSGVGTAMLPAEGGSASLRLLSGMIGVFPGADYGVSVRVRTEAMVHARAGIAARLLDQEGRVLEVTEARSELVRTHGDWTTVSLEVPGLDDRAAYLQLEMLVLQPRQQPGMERDRPFRVWNEDFHARAWFDDLTVTLLPRMELDTGVPAQVVPADRRPEIGVLIRDLTGEYLEAAVRVLGPDGRVVDTLDLDPGQGRMLERFLPDLPAPGWYTAVLTVEANGSRVGVKRLDFAWGAPEDADAARASAFGLRAAATTPETAAAFPTMAAWTGVGHAVVGVWDEWMTAETAAPDANPAFGAIRTLLDRGVAVTAGLDEAPRDLADLIGRDAWDVPSLLSSDEGLWLPWAGSMLDRFGQGVLSWQIGARATEVDGGRLAARVDAAGEAIAKWVPGPEIRAAWPPGFAVPREMIRPGRGLVVRDDGAGSDRAIEDLVAEWAARGAAAGDGDDRTTLTLEFPASSDGRVSRAALGRLARRVIGAWAAAQRAGVADRVRFTLAEPWRSTGGLRPTMMPTPELAAWRTLSSMLGDPSLTAVRELDLLPGVRVLLAGHGDEGVLIAWLEDPEAPVRTLDLPLTVGPARRVDLLGARRELQPMERPEMGLSWHRVELSREPVVVEGVRTGLVEFLAALRLTPERLEPMLGNRRHTLVIRNPWDFPIRGRVFIVEPGGLSDGTANRDRSWQINPRVVSFSMDAGETREEPIDLGFGAGQESGWTEAVFDVQLSADAEYPLLRVARRLEIASQDMGLEVVAYRTDAGAVSVHAMVTNASQEARSVEIAAVAPGAARERATINGLTRGETGERRFLLFGVAPGARISVGLTEPKTGLRLTRTIDAP